MNYAEMSDFEINHLVAKVSGVNIKCIMLDSDDNHNGVIVGMKYSKERMEFNPCNSWADAGPIIQGSGIELNYDGISWSAASRFRDVGWYSDWKNHPESPLRIAMIVFLMIKDKEANNESH